MSFSLTNQFLIAMPGLNDPNFSRTVTLICEHTEDGALGFVINQPTDIPVAELLSQQEITFETDNPLAEAPLYSGGPVETQRGFILHSPEMKWETTMEVDESFCLTSSRDVIEAAVAGEGPKSCMFILGYAGWAAGQLEQELAENAWLTTEADQSIVFNLPFEQRWQAAAEKLGVDLSLLNSTAGHA